MLIAQKIAQKAMQQLYNYRLKTLRELEPNNPYLLRKLDSEVAPGLNDLSEIGGEINAAERRHAERGSAPKRPRGESEQAVTGRAAHDFHKADTVAKGGKGDVRIGQSGRADALFQKRRDAWALIEELKRKDQLKRAEREAEAYAKEHERLNKQPTDWRGVTYDADELWDRIRRDSEK